MYGKRMVEVLSSRPYLNVVEVKNWLKDSPGIKRNGSSNCPLELDLIWLCWPIVQNLVATGMTESDIGVIVGFQGKNSNDWLNEFETPSIQK